MGLLDHPAECRYIMEKVLERSVEEALALCRAGVDGLMIEDLLIHLNKCGYSWNNTRSES